MRKSIVRLCVVALVIAALAAAGGCGKNQAAVETAEKVPVETVQVAAETVSPSMSYSGTVVPWRKVLLGAQIQGRVEKLHVDVGDRVTKGDLLVELAAEQLTEARARFAAMESDYERMRSLAATGAVSPQAFEQTQAAYEAAKAGYDLVVGSAQLRAPFSGIVSARYLDEGEVYTLMSMMTPAPAVLEIVKHRHREGRDPRCRAGEVAGRPGAGCQRRLAVSGRTDLHRAGSRGWTPVSTRCRGRPRRTSSCPIPARSCVPACSRT